MNFTRQLAVFMRAGIPIMEALEVIVEETQNKMLKGVLNDMVDSLRAGDTFAAAAAAHPAAFPSFYVGILESAELTGNLDNVLNQLADYIDRDQKARGKVLRRLFIQPSWRRCQWSPCWCLQYSSCLASRSSSSPSTPSCHWSPGCSSTPRHSWASGGTRSSRIVIIVVGGLMAMQRSPGGKAKLDAFKLKLPVVGDLTETAIIERTCRVLASMLRAGVDLPRSMAVTAESSNNAVYRNALEKIREAMMQGQGLAEPIAQSGLFPAAARQMFRVGEETGTLDQQLEVAAAYYGRELETKLERATALFEPAIIIFMGVVVGFVAVALISAMYGIYNQVKVG